VERYCTACGTIATRKNDSLYVCGAGHDNWINPAVGVSAYVIKNGKVLFGVRSSDPGKGKLDVPGGFVEVHESAEQAAIREAKEEFGIDITVQHCLGTYPGIYNGRPSLDIAFVASMTDQDIKALDDMSGGKPVWRSMEDLPASDEVVDQWVTAAQKDLLVWWRKNPQLY
jgi:ADP-ribose pyrophosphatase YjhB (NUDIX family)